MIFAGYTGNKNAVRNRLKSSSSNLNFPNWFLRNQGEINRGIAWVSWLVLLHSFSDGNHEKQFHKDKCVRFFTTLKWQQLLCIEMGKIHRNRFGIVYLSSRFHYMPECCLWIGFRAYVVKVRAPQEVIILSEGAFVFHALHFLFNFRYNFNMKIVVAK